MSEFPLYDALLECPEPLTRMQEHLRDEGRTWDQVETRRKSELRQHLLDWKEGKHAILVLLGALETTLGHEHPLGYLPRVAKDLNSFDHLLNRGKEKLEPEEFQKKRKEHIESLVKKNLHPQFYQTSSPDPQHQEWVDRLLSSMDERRSIDIADVIISRMMQSRGGRWSHSSEFGMGAVKSQLQTLRTNEDIDKLVHPNDAHLETDIFDTLLTHEPRMTSSEHHTRDEYQTQEDIELRRSVEIIAILKEWKAGAHPFLVISDILDVAFNRFENPLSGIISAAQSNKKSEAEYRKEKVGSSEKDGHHKENMLVHTLKEQASIRRNAKQIMRAMREDVVAYRGPETHPEFAAQIDLFIEHLQSVDERSFSIIQGIAEAMFQPVDEPELAKPELDEDEFDDLWERDQISRDAPLLTRIRHKLENRQAEEDARFEANKPMGQLQTQTEDEAKEPLRDIFLRRARAKRRANYTPYPKLTDKINIVPSGSGMIKPFPTGEYDEKFEEEMYGTTTARITTYSVSFVPKDPAQTQQLAGYVRWALKRIANMEPAFEIPFDSASDPYERPTRSQGWSSKRAFYKNTYVKITDDGYVQPEARLDLDDLWLLYYLLEDIIEPSEQIAASMNAARYAEERGVLLIKGDMDRPYSNTNMRPENQMGSLDQEDPANYVPAMMQHTLSLYALGEIDEEQLLQRMLVLADHTLTGRMVDPHGALPTFNRITDQSKGGAVITYDDALKERAREIMMIMTGTQDKDRPLFPALIQKVAEIGKPLRDHLRGIAQEREEAFWADVMERWPSFGKADWRTQWSEKFEGLDREGEEEPQPETDADTAEDREPAEKKDTKGLAYHANIVLRQSEVGATTDRSWRGTNYVSRSGNSLWVRKEMPAALKAFMRNEVRPDTSSIIRALTHET